MTIIDPRLIGAVLYHNDIAQGVADFKEETGTAVSASTLQQQCINYNLDKQVSDQSIRYGIWNGMSHQITNSYGRNNALGLTTLSSQNDERSSYSFGYDGFGYGYSWSA